MLGQVVVHDERRTACVAEVLANRSASEWCVELERSRVGRRRRHHHGVSHGARFFQGLHDASHGGTLLAHSDVDAEHRLTCVVEFLLVDDGVDRHGGLSSLAVANDQLSLATTDRNHRVDGLDACLQRLVHRLTVDHTGSLALDRHVEGLALDGSFSVNGFTQHVDHAAQHALAHLDACDGSCALHGAAFLQVS